MRIFASDPAHFAASQLRFLLLLRRYWWLLLLLSLALLLHTMRNAPVLPLLVVASLLVGAGSYFLLLRFDLTLNHASVAFGLLIFMAMAGQASFRCGAAGLGDATVADPALPCRYFYCLERGSAVYPAQH